jgi:hypothetical protein
MNDDKENPGHAYLDCLNLGVEDFVFVALGRVCVCAYARACVRMCMRLQVHCFSHSWRLR